MTFEGLGFGGGSKWIDEHWWIRARQNICTKHCMEFYSTSTGDAARKPGDIGGRILNSRMAFMHAFGKAALPNEMSNLVVTIARCAKESQKAGPGRNT